LRQRREDIPLLVSAFLKQFAEENGRPFPEITPEAMEALLRYDWPGNVRQLRNVIENCVVMTPGPKIGLRNIPPEVREASDGGGTLSSTKFIPLKGNLFNIKQTEYKLILQALEETGGNITQAAKKLGISRRTLHRKINEIKESKEE
jgi:DNA-binding NtrC family response regulator